MVIFCLLIKLSYVCSQKEHLPDSETLVPFHIMECAVPFVLHELHTTSGGSISQLLLAVEALGFILLLLL